MFSWTSPASGSSETDRRAGMDEQEVPAAKQRLTIFGKAAL
jgi:hypothetical protein